MHPVHGLTKEVRDFAAGWNKGRFRNLSYRVDPLRPRRKVVIASERSWGDEPDVRSFSC